MAITILEWIFIAVGVIWISEFVFFRNRGIGRGDAVENRSFLFIFTALFSTIVAAMLLQEFQAFDSAVLTMQSIGLLLLALGVFLRFWGILHLKSQFTRHVTVREGDEIVSSGPYRKLRHPLYTGLLLITIGMALFFTSLIAAVVGGIAVTWALMKRIKYEEQLLVQKFGSDYEEWMEHRARLIPFIY